MVMNSDSLATKEVPFNDVTYTHSSFYNCICHKAKEFAEEYAYDYGENLDAALDVNAGASDEFRKHQMIAEFQEELTKIYMDMSLANEGIDYKKKQEYEAYQDIMNGIIII